jgi:uncharacterized protein
LKRTDWRVTVGDASVAARYEPSGASEAGVFVCAHGAGGNMLDRGMERAAAAMRAAGLGVVRFNFLYKERGSGRPDPMPKLMECAAAVVAHARAELEPKTLLVGGRSMGGRACSMLAAEGFDADGLLLLAYPLHPPKQPEKLRDAHLPAIAMPVLCFNGTRDEFCDPTLMKAALRKVKAPWTMHWVEGADHSFHVLKASGRNDAAVMDEVTAATRSWLATL